jgi:predicted MFS family arabinose efflux permease
LNEEKSVATPVADSKSSSVAQELSPRATRYALGMLTLAYAFNFIDRQILVILQVPIKEEMGLMDWQLGLLSGFAFALIYVTAGIPIAYLADRGNRRNIIAIAVTVWSGMTALSGLANGFGQLLAARVGVGLGEAGGSPPAHAMISDYYPPEKRASALGVYSAGLHFGIMLGFLLGAAIEVALGWRAAFMAVGIPGVLFAVIFFLTVKEPQRGRWDTGEDAAYQPTLGETVRTLIKIRSFWLISIACGLTAFGGYGVGNFLPVFMNRSHGFEGIELGLLMAIGGGGAGLAGTLIGGRLADRFGKHDRRWYLGVPAIAGGVALPLVFPFLLSDNLVIVVPLIVIVTMLTNSYLGPCLATVHALVPPAMRALTSAILFFVLNLIGLGMGPLVAGLLSDRFTETYGAHGLRYALLIVACIAATGAIPFLMAIRSLPGDFERRDAMAAQMANDGS